MPNRSQELLNRDLRNFKRESLEETHVSVFGASSRPGQRGPDNRNRSLPDFQVAQPQKAFAKAWFLGREDSLRHPQTCCVNG